jgi:hypothetical protein
MRSQWQKRWREWKFGRDQCAGRKGGEEDMRYSYIRAFRALAEILERSSHLRSSNFPVKILRTTWSFSENILATVVLKVSS